MMKSRYQQPQIIREQLKLKVSLLSLSDVYSTESADDNYPVLTPRRDFISEDEEEAIISSLQHEVGYHW